MCVVPIRELFSIPARKICFFSDFYRWRRETRPHPSSVANCDGALIFRIYMPSFIDFYNNHRPHSSIGMKPPAIVHNETGIQPRMW